MPIETTIWLATDGTLMISGWRGSAPITLHADPIVAIHSIKRILRARGKAAAQDTIGTDAQPLTRELQSRWTAEARSDYRRDAKAAEALHRAERSAQAMRTNNVDELFAILTEER